MEKHIQYTNTFKLNHMVKYSKLKSWIPECFYLSFHEVTDTLESNSKKKIKCPFNFTVIFYLLYFRYVQQLIISFSHLLFLFYQTIQNPAHVTGPVNEVLGYVYTKQASTFMSGSLICSLLPQPYWSRSTRYQYCKSCVNYSCLEMGG